MAAGVAAGRAGGGCWLTREREEIAVPFVQGTTQCVFCHYAIARLENVFQCPVCVDVFFHSDCVTAASQRCPTCFHTAGDDDRLLQTTVLPDDEGIAWSVTSADPAEKAVSEFGDDSDSEGGIEFVHDDQGEGGYEADDEGDGGRRRRAPVQAPAPPRAVPQDYGEDLDQASGALRAGLIDFLRAAPDPTEWVYEGRSPSGPVLSWTGDGEQFGLQGTVTVRLHLHRKSSAPGWSFGSVWIEGVKRSGLGIGRVLTSSGDDTRLVAVVRHFMPRIRF